MVTVQESPEAGMFMHWQSESTLSKILNSIFPAVKIMAAVSGNTIGMKHREARISFLGFLIMIFP